MSTQFFGGEGMRQLFCFNDSFLGRVVLQKKESDGMYRLHVGSRDVDIQPTDDGFGEVVGGGIGATCNSSETGMWERAYREHGPASEDELAGPADPDLPTELGDGGDV